MYMISNSVLTSSSVHVSLTHLFTGTVAKTRDLLTPPNSWSTVSQMANLCIKHAFLSPERAPAPCSPIPAMTACQSRWALARSSISPSPTVDGSRLYCSKAVSSDTVLQAFRSPGLKSTVSPPSTALEVSALALNGKQKLVQRKTPRNSSPLHQHPRHLHSPPQTQPQICIPGSRTRRPTTSNAPSSLLQSISHTESGTLKSFSAVF
ncbi:hypothetical protein AC578_3345 [Pseudocercospora eumusae]|uniref:Uncharacterized protein n=1 Tax=Pseudocercospora eumusae TaxID=321146 RepID=A0A139HDC2_9PEZI|nr:hypothetical protein AC578_3345 [Pseudocercospora eumusae]